MNQTWPLPFLDEIKVTGRAGGGLRLQWDTVCVYVGTVPMRLSAVDVISHRSCQS